MDVVHQTNTNFNSSLTIKDHQVSGTEWCVTKEESGQSGALVADEMGLGKTIIMLMTMLIIPKKSTLIVVPASLLHQWIDQIKRIIGTNPLVFYSQKKKKITSEMLVNSSIVITTYHSIAISKKEKQLPSKNPLHNINWDRVIYDEAHHLRNRNALWHGATLVNSGFTWVITGTPVQNKLTDFRNICKAANITNWNDSVLLRTKNQVGITLPPPVIHNITVPWSNPEELSLARETHFKVRNSVNPTDLIVEMQLCRQACTYPKLLEKNVHHIENNILSQPRQDTLDLAFNQHSKLDAVVDVLSQRRNNNNGKLVFCQFRDEMTALKNMLTAKNISVTMIDPSISHKRKFSILTANPIPENSYIEGLNKDVSRIINSYLKSDVTILQIMSSCEGLNLQDNFSEVYFVSPTWNPSVESQAIARCHRIGQKKQVEVFRFYMEQFTQSEFPQRFDISGNLVNYYNLDQYILRKQNWKNTTARDFLRSILDT
uniref:Helicase ATP-binding domain-containing protein n=1 Tax=viral metagenome TaxID=1070528 RepID=A0A6C0BTG2_9ZZZZ